MRSVTLIFLLIFTILVSACENKESQPYFPYLEYAASKDGLIKDYKYRSDKPKVVTYISELKFFKGQIKYDFGKENLQDFIDKNNDFEFIFYARISANQIDSAINILKTENIKQVYYFDTENIFMEKFIHNKKTISTTSVYDNNNKLYGHGVMSGKFINQIKKKMDIVRNDLRTSNN